MWDIHLIIIQIIFTTNGMASTDSMVGQGEGVEVLVQLVAEDKIVEIRMMAMRMVVGLVLCCSLVLYDYMVLCH
jgi:hypothetical protein